ncbi:hypothetical protein SLOPH_723 [Spraguea lophii 42_110]|uniref:Uncharacterized protein n=1 Tax=Spraguea lophii (strain 42_110) TaxID=1358809 RepID=S7XUM1_SPRLO|nr:hypothetical protein SLOPH_723 [Spraguea lophii 42_110]
MSENNNNNKLKILGFSIPSFLLLATLVLFLYTYFWEKSCILWSWYYLAIVLVIILGMSVIGLFVKDGKLASIINAILSIVGFGCLFMVFYTRTVSVFVRSPYTATEKKLQYGYILVYLGSEGTFAKGEQEEKFSAKSFDERLKKGIDDNAPIKGKENVQVPLEFTGEGVPKTEKGVEGLLNSITGFRYASYFRSGVVEITGVKGLSSVAKNKKIGIDANEVEKYYEKDDSKKKSE